MSLMAVLVNAGVRVDKVAQTKFEHATTDPGVLMTSDSGERTLSS